MELTAAPVLRRPMEVIGAPGKTDYVRIYIATELNKPEYRTILRHEQAHVWGRHNARRPKEARQDLWTIAIEMEIARQIYDQTDIANITAPRSRLAGGYLPGSIDGLPDDVEMAEDIYAWLLENPQAQPPAVTACACCAASGHTEQGEPPADPKQAIQAAREKLDADERASTSQAAAWAAYKDLRDRPPSLTEAVDAALRVRVQRERSYRRPSRRHEGSDILAAGAISTPRPPLVEIFVDRSGSFSPDKTARAEQRLSELLKRYGATIRADVWFFGAGKLAPTDPGGGGDTPYHLISQHLEKTQPRLAVVITDDDPVGASVTPLKAATRLLCVPIGCARTNLAAAMGGTDVGAAA